MEKKKRTGPEIRTRDHWLSFAVLNFISPAQQDLVLAPELRPCVSHTLLFQTGICSAVVLFLLYHSILYVSESKKVVMTHTTLSETSCKVGALFQEILEVCISGSELEIVYFMGKMRTNLVPQRKMMAGIVKQYLFNCLFS